MSGRSRPAILVLLLASTAGLGLGILLNDALGIRFEDKPLPEEGPLPRTAGRDAGGPLPWRLVGPGAVGVEADPAHWRGDYSHHGWAFRHVLREAPPWVDPESFARVERDWRIYLERMRAYGFNGVVFHAFLELVNFDRVGDGHAVYSAASPWRERHRTLRARFRELFRVARDLDMRVVLGTDMIALTPPLERYLRALPGGLDPSRPEVWEVYRAGVEELLDAVPEADGLLIRIGEAGSVYNIPGWDYRSELLVRDAESVQRMLHALLPAFESRGRTLVFRTWSVGVGGIGDMHTNPETYARVLGDVDSESLVVSTKFVMGDFYGFLPFNPTLFSGRHRRWIELQARREFEGMGAFPNDVVPVHREAIRRIRAANPRVEGVWLWTWRGGPPRAGPFLLYPFAGHVAWVDANVHGTGGVASDPEAEPAELARAWAREHVGGDSEAVDAVAEVLLRSRRAVRQGLYVGCFARRRVLALGLEPPPQMWIFEWDVVAGASSVLSAMHHLCRGEALEAAVAEGRAAVREVEAMQELLAGAAGRVREPAALEAMRRSLDYERDLLETLAAWREAFLRYYAWLAGEAPDRGSAARALADFEARRKAHESRYGDDLQHPAYSFFAVEAGLRHVRRDLAMAWSARALLVGITLLLALGARAARKRAPGPAGSALAVLWAGALAPWRLDATPALGPAGGVRLATWVASVAAAATGIFSSFLSPAFVLGLIGPVAAGLATALALAGAKARDLRVVGGVAPVLLVAGVFLVPCAVRGPLFFWQRFWTSPGFRVLFATAAVVALGWLGFALFEAARRMGRRPTATAVGLVAVAAGVPLAGIGLALGAPGLENALTAVNDDLAVLPLGLSRILGITVHLGLPPALPRTLAAAGAGLALAGAAPLLHGARSGAADA